jgi:hypothetical protein
LCQRSTLQTITPANSAVQTHWDYLSA